MKKLKNISLILVSAFVFIFSAIIFTGCKDKNETARLFVFSTEGGYIEVNNEDIVRFGDEGKIFKFKEDQKVSLKAVALDGYDFVKWEYTDDLDEDEADFSMQSQISLKMDEDEIVIKAVFASNGTIIKYNVNYDTNTTGYSIVAEDGYSRKVLSGGNFKFKVNLQSEYSDSNIIVKANNTVLTADEYSIYTINNIAQDVTITVEGVIMNAPETYTISTNDNRVTILPTNGSELTVVAGSSFSFDLTLVEGFKFDDGMVVRANGQLLHKNNGVYTITNINSDIQIIVEGIISNIPNTYKISLNDNRATLVPTNGSELTVVAGSSFSFSLVPVKGYRFTEGLVVRAEGEILQKSNGVYTILNINSNIEIILNGIEKLPETYTISLNDNRAMIIPTNGNELEVEAGSSFSFELIPAEGYKFTEDLVVRADEQILNKTNGVYTITNINSNIEIILNGVEAIATLTYNFNLNFEDEIEDFIGSDILNFPQGFSFTIIEADSKVSRYDASEFMIKNSYGEDVSMRDLFADINEELVSLSLGFDEVKHFAIENKVFIYIDESGIMNIDWSLINHFEEIDVTIVV